MAEEKSKLKQRLVVVGLFLALILTGFGIGIGLAALAGGKNAAEIPTSIAEKVLFPTYLPEPLPKGYTVAEDSFHVEEGALLFQATNSSKKISFAEQSKPKGFDFDEFYKQLTDIKNLQDVPYTSVLGKTQDGKLLLSIVTDKTWLILTSQNASEADLRFIAEHLKQQ